MSRGRPVNSVIRQNIVEILFDIGKGYGYDIYKKYLLHYPEVTLRSIYYHLKKGTEIGEFEIERIEKEKGDYSWGETAEKIYYKLGKSASPKGNIKKNGEPTTNRLHKERQEIRT
jgi:hypothetical protein